MLTMSIAIGSKRVVCSQQFHLKYGEAFDLMFQDNDKPFTIRFIQKIEAAEATLLPFSKPKHPASYIKPDDKTGEEGLCYILGNFNQTKITTNPIPFYTKPPTGRYYFQISAVSISSEVDNPSTIWIYTVTIYEED